MKFVNFKTEKEFNNFIKDASLVSEMKSGAEFLESWEWGEILRAGGEEILRIGVSQDGKILAAATLVKKFLGGGCFYWYTPRGPIINYKLLAANAGEEINNYELIKFLFTEIKKINSRAIFWRLEPNLAIPNKSELRAIKNEPELGTVKLGPGFLIKKTLDLQPVKTLILDLTTNAPELLTQMQQKTRYNIRLAEKKGVKIKVGRLADFPEFWRLLALTGARDNFRLHEVKHYKNLLNFNQDFIRLYLAEYQGRCIAAGLFCFWGDKVTYLHGASDNNFRGVMAPYLLQWSVIKEAQRSGYSYYDFYGINEKKWPGVTRFKNGFSGRPVEYAGTYDAIFRPGFYWFYELMRRLRRLR